MYTLSENCPIKVGCLRGGKGELEVKTLATPEEMYGKVFMFAQISIDPGKSIGWHNHPEETEFYYITEGEGVFNDNGTEVIVHAGDVCSTGNGAYHSIENKTDKPLVLVALIVKA